jgi:hypothetical protein
VPQPGLRPGRNLSPSLVFAHEATNTKTMTVMTPLFSTTFQATVGVLALAMCFSRSVVASVVSVRFYFQVLRSVVEGVFILVVNNFHPEKWSVKNLRHYQTVFGNIAILAGIRMVHLFDKAVALSNCPRRLNAPCFGLRVEAFRRTKYIAFDVARLAVNRLAAVEALKLRFRFQAFTRAKHVRTNLQTGNPLENKFAASLAGVHVVHRRIIPRAA